MPRPGPRLPALNVRMPKERIAALDNRANIEGVNRSEVVNRLIAFALVEMPFDWEPEVKP